MGLGLLYIMLGPTYPPISCASKLACTGLAPLKVTIVSSCLAMPGDAYFFNFISYGVPRQRNIEAEAPAALEPQSCLTPALALRSSKQRTKLLLFMRGVRLKWLHRWHRLAISQTWSHFLHAQMCLHTKIHVHVHATLDIAFAQLDCTLTQSLLVDAHAGMQQEPQFRWCSLVCWPSRSRGRHPLPTQCWRSSMPAGAVGPTSPSSSFAS